MLNNGEDVKVVNSIILPVSLVVFALLIFVFVYFCVMRNKTVRMGKHLLASQQRKNQLYSGASSEMTSVNSPNKTMSLVSFDRMSPEKVIPYPVTESLNQPPNSSRVAPVAKHPHLDTPGGALGILPLATAANGTSSSSTMLQMVKV